ncbi:LCP family protein [Nesterenkonia flava]|uniref:LCP family protein n=1 Tax=Nesterenkonia flava TaxID=469799 RepID=A0ABU1FR12_9MICC|nr:LCP family protein [Nesterenkonia flava]MDR5710792.1 LCP family protein [Nesterenkonia flava]
MNQPNITYHRFDSQQDVVRNPALASDTERTRRAVILTALTTFLPGGAQITAGSRRIGRAALAVTVGCWLTLLLGVLMYLTMRGVLLSALTQPFIMWLGSVILVLLALGWLFLWLDTARLVRFAKLAPGLRPILGVVMVVLMVITSGGLAYGAHVLNQSRHALAGIFSAGPAIDATDGRYNFLLMGADAGEGREGVRPDSIHVVSVNAETAETIIFSIPRNFQNARFSEDSPMREVYPEGFNCGNDCIINFLYTEVTNNYSHLYPEAADPGAEAMMDAVSGTLDLPVDGYVMIDMAGFEQLIDAMGGVTVQSDGWVPHRGHRPDGTWGWAWWEPGTYTFNGQEALGFARSREWSSDYNRIQRQQCIQQAMVSQFSPQTLLTRFTEIMQAGENLVETNLPQSQLGSLLDLAVQAQQNEPQRLVLGAPDFGSSGDLFSTYPDFDQIHARVDQLMAAEGGGEEESDDEASAPADPAPEGDSGSADGGSGTDGGSSGSAPGPTPEHSDEAVAGDEAAVEEPSVPTQPDGSPLTEEYLVQVYDEAQARGEYLPENPILLEAASTNGGCAPA